MMNAMRPVAAAVLCLLAQISLITLAHRSQTSMHVRIHETALRKRAIRVVMPDYPKESQKRGAKGIAVVQLEINEEGSVTESEVLEAPDTAIKEAVISAVKQWQFKPATANGVATRIRSKLTFYYVIDGRNARVENPK